MVIEITHLPTIDLHGPSRLGEQKYTLHSLIAFKSLNTEDPTTVNSNLVFRERGLTCFLASFFLALAFLFVVRSLISSTSPGVRFPPARDYLRLDLGTRSRRVSAHESDECRSERTDILWLQLSGLDGAKNFSTLEL